MNVPDNMHRIRRLIWVYFWLLVVEGALRKWVAPSAANALLVVRDPVVILIYVLAFQSGIYPRNLFLTCLTVLAFLMLIAGLFVMQDAPFVALYGFRADFLHLPLVFLIPKVFDADDVRKMGYWTLLLSVPLALLMVAQFEAPSSSFLNAGAGEGAAQIASAGGHIRPAATFSYILGAVYFYSLVAVFLIDSLFTPGKHPRWLLVGAALSLPIAAAVSGSRTFLANLGIVFACALVAGVVLQPRLRARCLQIAFVILTTGLVVNQIPTFQEGTKVFSSRIENAGEAEGGGRGFVDRGLRDYTGPLTTWYDVPFLGNGLGMGTNAGAAMLTGTPGFLLAEGEWDRVLMESGPVLGGLFLLLRICLAITLARASVRAARRGSTLPFLSFGGCVTVVVNGQFSQPAVLGFAALIGGLCLAAVRARRLTPGPAAAPHTFHPAGQPMTSRRLENK